MGGPLPEGTLQGHVVTCPWHGSQYDVRTGRALRGPYRLPIVSRLLKGLAKPATTYPARLVGGSVEVDLEAASRPAAT
jgi:nitrite reductase/ring-hydroxylating ferredoxin subunit